MKRTKLCQLGLFVLLLLSLFGCGGAGGSGSGLFNLFITDDASATYSGVWVKVYKAELKGDGGKSVVLFNNPDGLVVNLRQLNDGASKFLLLAPGQVPDGTYNKVQFEVNKKVDLVAKSNGAASTANFPNTFDNPAGNSLLAVNLSPAVVMPGAGKVVVDFDLKNWNVVGGVISPVLKHHDGTGLEDGSRHERFEYHGAVGNLGGAAPAQTFDLTLRGGGTVHVTTDDTTDIVNDANGAGLANGRNAEVFGTYDPATSSVKANIIHFAAASEEHELAKAAGMPSNINAEAGTFNLAPKYTRGFAPKGETVLVAVDANTHFQGKHGAGFSKADFFTAMQAAGDKAIVDLKGNYDGGTNTITAKEVHIENESEFGDAKANGQSSNPNAELNSFDLTAIHTEGFDDPGQAFKVQLSPDVEIKGPNGSKPTKAEFFTLFGETSPIVRVKGSYNSDTKTLLATRLEFVTNLEIDVVAKGGASAPNTEAGSFSFLIREITGVNLPGNGEPQTITIGANTILKDSHGNLLSNAQFFALFGANALDLKISAHLTLPSGNLVINKIEVQASESHDPEARGGTSLPNAEAGSFALTVAEAHGFDAPEGPLNVVLGEGAVLKGPQGISINRGQLFSYITEHSRTVKVTGTYAGGTFTATKVELIFN